MKIFDAVLMQRPKRNKFDLSHERKMTLDMGQLYPMLVQEVVPGDRFRVSSDVFLRFLALVAPVMHRVDVTVHYFFVPNRLVWANWQNFITGGVDGLQNPPFPTFNLGNVNALSGGPALMQTGSLLDYMGFPVMKSTDTYNSATWNGQYYNALPLRAYLLIYDQYYRDQNTEVTSPLTANFLSDGSQTGLDLNALLLLRRRSWEKDYFTSALPWTQRGAPVNIPMTITAQTGHVALVRDYATGAVVAGTGGVASLSTDGSGDLTAKDTGSTLHSSYIDPNGSLVGSGLTVNALRLSIRLQEWLEKNATGGSRYIEQIKAHFGVVSSDSRLQRVEYLGGGRQPVVVSEVLQHTPVTSGTPLGNMGGHALSVGTSNQFSRFFEEHGHVIGIISVLPKTAYQTSLPPWFWRTGNTQYFWPSFAHLGEQVVYNQEVYTNPADGAATPGGTFGYQSRYAEYKFNNNIVSGQFRETLAFWGLQRIFTTGNQPALNTAFVTASPRTDIFAVQSGQPNNIVCQIQHRIDALRPIPYFGTPSF